MFTTPVFFTLLVIRAEPLGPGTHERTLEIAGVKRQYILHVPRSYDSTKPAPLILAYHGAGMGARMMMRYSDLNRKAEEAGFLVVYPNGTGAFPTWNAGGVAAVLNKGKVDDVAFTREILEEVGKLMKVDAKRIYACGLSNGAMMCYRLAAELSDRIAAVAPVAGTMTVDKFEPKHPVPVLHIHGTEDTLVPYERAQAKGKNAMFLRFRGVEESVQACVKANGCKEEPEVEKLPRKEGDPTEVIRKCYRGGKEGAEVILYTINRGGHTWPGSSTRIPFLGNTSRVISANDVMWEFFQKHARK